MVKRDCQMEKSERKKKEKERKRERERDAEREVKALNQLYFQKRVF